MKVVKHADSAKNKENEDSYMKDVDSAGHGKKKDDDPEDASKKIDSTV